ncbi:Zn(2)-C6 fungal-type DNA-binding domain protein [Metarhizium rileyi]|uniref:Zn(2)-C6 fungal-type DNA-binding domain protein n=1 Tax=Metarhizium rileyi (strain RCEF 4871) TaxID=1649241 RepID=A0A162J4N8_METRR|nr:Zn(2)-C6 fungal-type DNA-binding domain protein [Metarhizium rileyi RCEF 4871]
MASSSSSQGVEHHHQHQLRKSRRPGVPRIKFRSSCDLCTEAKVRCDKQHPQCGRCVRIGSSCHYSVSMRSGKPAINLFKSVSVNAAKVPTSPRQSAPSDAARRLRTLSLDELLRQQEGADQLSHSHSHSHSHAVHAMSHGRSSESVTECSTPPGPESVSSSLVLSKVFHDQETTSLDIDHALPDSPCQFQLASSAEGNKMMAFRFEDATDLPFNDYFSTMESDFQPSAALDSQSLGFSLSVHPLLDSGYRSHSDVSDLESPGLSKIATPPMGVGANDDMIATGAALQHPHIQMTGHSCLRTAKEIQRSIIRMAPGEDTMRSDFSIQACTPPIISTDQALLTCSSSSQRLIDILQCECEADAHLPFLVAVLISKMLAIYGAIAKLDDATSFDWGSVARFQQEQEQEQKQKQEQEQEQKKVQEQDVFGAVQLQFGAYSVVDKELEEVLTSHLVLHEVSKLGRLITLYDDKYCQGGQAESSSEALTIYSALSQFIQGRYTRTRAACELEIRGHLPTAGTWNFDNSPSQPTCCR